MDREKSLQFAEKRFDEWKEKLISLCAIPSISFAPYHKSNLEKAASFTQKLLVEAGITNTELLSVKDAPPYVYGERLVNKNLPTVLLYAHYDVQPPMRENFWHSKPFSPEVRDGRLYARGASDDKAGVMVHIASIKSILLADRELPVNIKILIEGEEECSSPHLANFMQKYGKRLIADCAIVMDLVNYETGLPSLTTSLRGMVSLQITVRTLKKSLHSGMWGGPIPDPISALAKIIASLTNEDGSINIPHIYDSVRPINPIEEKSYNALNMQHKILQKQADMLKGVKIFGENGTDILKNFWRKPSLIINAMEAGGKDITGNVLMNEAWARIGIRIVPDQKPKQVINALVKHIKANTPWNVKTELKIEPHSTAWITDTTHPIFQIASQSMEKGYGRPSVIVGCGGSIPFVSVIGKHLGSIPMLLTGIEDPYTNAHGENESQSLSDFKKAILSQIHFLYDLASDSDKKY